MNKEPTPDKKIIPMEHLLESREFQIFQGNNVFLILIGKTINSVKVKSSHYSVELNFKEISTISESPLVVVNVPSETWYWDDGLSTYVAVVSVTGVKESSSPELDIDTSNVTSQEYLNNLYLNWSYIYRATTGEDFITIYAMEQPSIDLNVLVKGY